MATKKAKELTVTQKAAAASAKRLAKLKKERTAIEAATSVADLQAAVKHLVGTEDLALLSPLVARKTDALIGV
ncbi:MAG: hypothetical protein GY832_25905 [Chloroflexi bacterium]|nr:hypothetical protein [Chloroflexota bacterium]